MANIKTKLIPMTPHTLFKMQVRGALDGIRYSKNKDYIPPQLGGTSGQRETIEQNVVLSVTEFEG